MNIKNLLAGVCLAASVLATGLSHGETQMLEVIAGVCDNCQFFGRQHSREAESQLGTADTA